jgi:hypothetical protein
MAMLLNHSIILAASLQFVAMASPANAARYVKPKDVVELFPLEKIPLQVHHMKELSRHLVIISRRGQDNSPVQLRATAQLLALAMSLDPTNQDAREINRTRAQGKQPESSPEADVLKSKARIQFFHRWLSHPDAGADANLLATLLTDSTKVLDPDTLKNTDIANWSGVLPPLRQYTSTPPAKPPQLPGKQNNTKPKIPKPQIATARFHIAELSIQSAVELKNSRKVWNSERKMLVRGRSSTSHKTTAVKVSLTPSGPDRKNHLTIYPIVRSQYFHQPSSDPIYNRINNTLISLLTSRHSDLPTDNIRVTISDGEYTRSNTPEALAAPVALMLEASLNNTPVRSDVHFCALIDNKGKLSAPKNLWLSLQTYRARASGGRLIVPTDAYELLSQQLVYGDPGFFTRWEIVSANTLDQALALATEHDKDPMAEASQQFESIRTAAEKTSITQLAVNNKVRSRLASILKLAPNHLSAKMLLLQGSGKRPMRFNQQALALVLLPSVKKMHHFLNNERNAEYLRPSAFKKIHDELRAEIDPLLQKRLLDSSYNPLYQEVLAQVKELRLIEKALIRANKGEYSYSGRKKTRKRFLDLRRKSTTLLEKTLITAGFPPPPKKIEEPRN